MYWSYHWEHFLKLLQPLSQAQYIFTLGAFRVHFEQVRLSLHPQDLDVIDSFKIHRFRNQRACFGFLQLNSRVFWNNSKHRFTYFWKLLWFSPLITHRLSLYPGSLSSLILWVSFGVLWYIRFLLQKFLEWNWWLETRYRIDLSNFKPSLTFTPHLLAYCLKLTLEIYHKYLRWLFKLILQHRSQLQLYQKQLLILFRLLQLFPLDVPQVEHLHCQKVLKSQEWETLKSQLSYFLAELSFLLVYQQKSQQFLLHSQALSFTDSRPHWWEPVFFLQLSAVQQFFR